MKTYLGLGDSMSIDFYTGVAGGGAVAQFARWLGEGWEVVDRSFDGCCMCEVPTDLQGDLITLTIGGNDLLADAEAYLAEGLESFAEEHLGLLRAIRARNPKSCFLIGNVYRPAAPLEERHSKALDEANRHIAENVEAVGGELVDIHGAFRGHESDYLTLSIEPTYAGAAAIADHFRRAYEASAGE